MGPGRASDKMLPLIARFGLIDDTMDIAGSLLIVAILIGAIDLPIFYNVSTTGWGTSSVILWGIITIVALAVLVMQIAQKLKNYL